MRLVNINKSFQTSSTNAPRVEVLANVNLEVKPSEFVAVTGPSGSGKTTLLHIMGLLDSPNNGSVIFDGKDLVKLSERKRTLWRREHLGFIFQFHNLLPEFTACENVALVARISGLSNAKALAKAKEVLQKLKLVGKEHKFPIQLSGGEQQRVAIARAIVNMPKLILADEPTGNLDHNNGLLVFEMMQNCVREFGITVVMVTHNRELAAKADRIFSLD